MRGYTINWPGLILSTVMLGLAYLIHWAIWG